MTTLQQQQDTAPSLPMPLDRFQQPAAESPPGPVIILGGAGSGRTHTLAARAKRLIDAGHSPATICCITGSSRNRDNLRRVLDQFVDDKDDLRRIFVCTYYHMASSLLRTSGAAAHLGISPHFTIWNNDQAIQVMQSLIESEPEELSFSNDELKDIFNWNGLNKARWKMGAQLPPKKGSWNAIIAEYSKEKKRQNVLDFNDLIPLAVDALENAPHIRDVWRKVRTSHILADDFHDISPIQYRLLQLTVGLEHSLTITIDPNQSVYGWRGADPRLVNKFKMDFSNARTFLLRMNHRHTRTLHDALDTLLNDEDMDGLSPSGQEPSRPDQGQPPTGIAYHGTQQEMNSHMMDLIEADVREGRCQWEDIAILFRRRGLGSNFINQLVSRNIPYTILGDDEGIDKGATRRTIALLTLTINPWDTASLAAAATIESDDSQRGLNNRHAGPIARISREQNINLLQAAEQYLPSVTKGVKTRKNLEYVISASTRVARLLNDPENELPDLCLATEQISRGSRSERYTASPASLESSKLLTMSRNSLKLPMETLRQHLARFLESLKHSTYPELQSADNADPYAHNSGLTISSINAAKGRQWKSVWLINTIDSVMPGRAANSQDPERLEEEQRLFYTGSSRATDMLHYIYYTVDAQRQPTVRSRFLDALDDVIVWKQPNQENRQ